MSGDVMLLTIHTDLNANGASHANVTANGSDTASLKKRVDEHQDTVNAILERFNEYLMSEVSKRDKLEKQVNEFQYLLKNVKGRVGVLESKFKAMVGDMDELEVAVNDVRNDNSFMSATTKGDSGPTSFFQDQIERLGSSVQAAMKKLKELEGDVDMHRVIINELNQNAKSDGLKFEQRRAVAKSAEGDGWATSSTNNGKAVGRSEDFDMVELHRKVVSAACCSYLETRSHY
jgi:archaellum component FlaC